MIALYLLAAHMVGDFVLQTRGQAENKLADVEYRTRHVCVYTLCFIPILVWRFHTHAALSDQGWRAVAFIAALYALHFATDTRRFHSTLGDWLLYEWTWLRQTRTRGRWLKYQKRRGHETRTRKPPLPANPWAPLPIMLDQSLHLIQLATLGGLLLT